MCWKLENESNILIIHKTINYILLFFTVYCHIKTSVIDPGSITTENNKAMLEFYYCFHQPFISRALKIIEIKYFTWSLKSKYNSIEINFFKYQII